MRFIYGIVGVVIGLLIALAVEPVAFNTNTCYHNARHEPMLITIFGVNDVGEMVLIETKQEIRSWSISVSNHLHGDVHECEPNS